MKAFLLLFLILHSWELFLNTKILPTPATQTRQRTQKTPIDKLHQRQKNSNLLLLRPTTRTREYLSVSFPKKQYLFRTFWIEALTTTTQFVRIAKPNNCSLQLNIKLPLKNYNPEVLLNQKHFQYIYRPIKPIDLFHIYHV